MVRGWISLVWCFEVILEVVVSYIVVVVVLDQRCSELLAKATSNEVSYGEGRAGGVNDLLHCSRESAEMIIPSATSAIIPCCWASLTRKIFIANGGKR